MIDIEYTPDKDEIIDASLDLMLQRPAIRFMAIGMKGCCAMLCFGFYLKWKTYSINPQDYMALGMAIAWMFYYRKINRAIVKLGSKKRKIPDSPAAFNVDKKRIFYKDPHKQTHNIEWRNIRFLLKNSKGYILPLTGLRNAGKYLWFPHRAFENEKQEEEFTKLVKSNKIRIKKAK